MIILNTPYMGTLVMNGLMCDYHQPKLCYSNDNKRKLNWAGEEWGDFLERCEKMTCSHWSDIAKYEYSQWLKGDL